MICSRSSLSACLVFALVASVVQLVAPTPAHALTTPAFVQSPPGVTSGYTSGSLISKAFSSNNSAGNTIVAAVSWDGTANLSCSDTRGNSYSVAITKRDTYSDQTIGICYASNIAVGPNTVTAHFSTSSSWRYLIVAEYSGVASASPVDATSANTAFSTTAANAVTSGAATTTTNGDLIFGMVHDTDDVTSITPGTGFTQRRSLNNKDFAIQDRVQETAGSVASTQTFGSVQRYVAAMVAFKPATDSPPSSVPTFVQSPTGVAGTSSYSTTVTRSFSTNNTQGNAIIAAVSWDGNSSMTCSDTSGNSYATAVVRYDSISGQSNAICYATNIAPGPNTVTATFGTWTNWRYLIVHEYSGIAASDALDVTSTNAGFASTGANAVTSGSATTNAANELVFGAVQDLTGETSITPGTGFTQRRYTWNKDFATQDKVQTTAGSVASTQTFGSSHRYVALMATFKPAQSQTPPIASFTATPTTGQAPLYVAFDGSSSSADTGTITDFAWAFGDGATATGATTSHLYAVSGTYTATLTVTDSNGGTASSTQVFNVDTPPALQFSITWSNGADFDLYVTEPNENLIYYGNPGPSSTGGQFGGDQGSCATTHPTGAQERTSWEGFPPEGTYVVEVDQYDTCGGTDGTWTLQVVVNGTVVHTQTGTGDGPDDIIYTYTGA